LVEVNKHMILTLVPANCWRMPENFWNGLPVFFGTK
jgi:hypothetical protein